MSLSGPIPLGGPGFGDKHTRSGIFGLGGGGTDNDGGAVSSLWRGGVGRGEGASGLFGGR
jgi:hypothetical protein